MLVLMRKWYEIPAPMPGEVAALGWPGRIHRTLVVAQEHAGAVRELAQAQLSAVGRQFGVGGDKLRFVSSQNLREVGNVLRGEVHKSFPAAAGAAPAAGRLGHWARTRVPPRPNLSGSARSSSW